MSEGRGIVRIAHLKVKNPSKPKLRTIANKHWVVLKSAAEKTKSRLEIYKDEEWATLKGTPSRVINLHSIIEVKSTAAEFVISTLDYSLTFVCSSQADVDDWMRDLDVLLHEKGLQDEEVKKFYFVMPEYDLFKVSLRQSKSLQFHGHCRLKFDRDFDNNAFYLSIYTDDEQSQLIVKWRIDHIRKYGSNKRVFQFQSGRRSTTGVDWFIFDSDKACASRINHVLTYWAQYIVRQAMKSRSISAGRTDAYCRVESELTYPLHSHHDSESGVYTKLDMGTREVNDIYEIPIDILHSPSNTSQSNASPPPYHSLYQPLRFTRSPTPLHVGVNEISRERNMSTCVQYLPHPTLIEEQYMSLTQNSRPQQEPQHMYMGISHSES